MPVRIQRKRTAGFNMQAQSPDGHPVVSVCRPGRWGNPNEVVDYLTADFVENGKFTLTGEQATALCLADYRRHVAAELQRDPKFLAPLRGRHLACFCPLSAPCHADLLLELANA